VKHLSSWRALVLLAAPALLLVALAVGLQGVGSSQYTGSVGTIVVGFSGSLPRGFQNISFNIASVRLNPSQDPSVSDLDPNWVEIPVSPGVGLNTTGISNPFTSLATLFSLNTTGPTPTAAGTGPSELQIDMGQLATQPELFNSWNVPASTYYQIELVLDSNSAGTLIPDCVIRPLEGCIASQIAMVNPTPVLRTSGKVTVPLGGVGTLVINIIPIAATSGTPAFSGANYTLSPAISVNTPNVMGLVTGQAIGATQVLAELSGTNQVVETTTLGASFYTLVLPAAKDGTAYDLVASGPGYAYQIASGVLVERGKHQVVDLNSTFVGGTSLKGKVTDACSGAAIQGATLEIVRPAPNTPNDCAQIPTPSNCVALASANTDDIGAYPMLPSNFVPQAFTNVAAGNYTMVVSAAGYDTVASGLAAGSGGAGCAAGVGGACNFALPRSTINGLVTLNPPLPAGSAALNVLVTAEDHGTRHIENVALATVPPGSASAPFSIFVPDNTTVASLDMYAAVSDLFSGLPEKYTGHTIAVMSNIPGSSACSTNPVGPVLTMQCVGHASVSGTTASFDPGTSIVLSKGGVQLIASGVIADGTPNPSPSATPVPGRFSFCAPADPQTYTLQRFEASPPGAEPSPAASPTSVTMLAPTTIGQPCSSICSNGSGACLVCQNKPKVEVP
jgi:hypothetical protein